MKDSSSGHAGKLRQRFVVTAALAVACVALFVLRYVWQDGGLKEHLLRMGANHGPSVLEGQWYRLLASAFLHGDPLHLFANMLALWSFGPVLEALFGPRRYLVLFGASALAGSAASAFLTEPRMSVGASGAVWGLMTAGIAIVYRPQGLVPEEALASARQRAWAPLAINLMYSFKPGVDFLAHLGGGAVGAALVLSGAITMGLRPLSAGPFSRRGQRGESPVWTGLAAVTGLAMIGSVAAGFAFGKPWNANEPPAMGRVTVADSGVSLLLPTRVLSRMVMEPRDGTTSYVYGDATVDPMMIEVLVTPLDAPIPAQDLEGELDGIRKAFAEKLQEDATWVAEPRLDDVGSRRAVVDELKLKSGLVVKRHVLLAGSRFVLVRSYDPGESPKSWAGIGRTIAESVEAK